MNDSYYVTKAFLCSKLGSLKLEFSNIGSHFSIIICMYNYRMELIIVQVFCTSIDEKQLRVGAVGDTIYGHISETFDFHILKKKNK